MLTFSLWEGYTWIVQNFSSQIWSYREAIVSIYFRAKRFLFAFCSLFWKLEILLFSWHCLLLTNRKVASWTLSRTTISCRTKLLKLQVIWAGIHFENKLKPLFLIQWNRVGWFVCFRFCLGFNILCNWLTQKVLLSRIFVYCCLNKSKWHRTWKKTSLVHSFSTSTDGWSGLRLTKCK